ncbi:FkbM family methyltransferase [Chamaesiphon minutus]|uniref:Methyltransferase, FkbM family n=1 Tax=Chamaesiphon minutus (strain ATCC 27169 / PCC 6605) TaxID=1173020 RepID=K9UB70_CHAP6|nr:FkbM family methyltransferase [Chamaesiphon minutus]AFY92090.1 methyltransferase, FkbM family [Chamaesiphon minutus PCC 6605]
MIDFDPKISYLNYVKQNQVEISETVSQVLNQSLDNCQWEQPETALDWNNLAVAALVAAESCDNSLAHGLYAEIAFDAVQAGAELNQHPLCAAHLALLNCMLGNYTEAAQIAFSAFINNLQPTYTEAKIAPGIVYIPQLTRAHITNGKNEQLQRILNNDNGYTQAMLMLTEVLCRTQISLDNHTGLRLLHLTNKLMPELILANLRLGIYSIGNQELEGLVYLHQAAEIALDDPTIVQSLYLAYLDLEQPEIAQHWQQIGRDYASQRLAKLPWQWTQLAIDSPWTYIPFIDTASPPANSSDVSSDDCKISLAVAASLQNTTTRCLLAEGNWFEREIEFWHQYLQPGMNAIDIGANIGIYTFSAASRVGVNGRVYAIEPFSIAVECLHETCQHNQIENVRIFRNAISDRDANARLILQPNCELNYIISANEILAPGTEIEEIDCMTLDTFVDRNGIDRLEIIKISTAGSNLAILQGCERTLANFAPTIIYNSYTSTGIDLATAQYLLDRDYELFRYQPYLQQLIPLANESDFNEVIKAIAIPKVGVN